MVDRWQTIQREVLSTARQRFFGKIDIEGVGSDACCANGKRAGIGKTVQEPLWCNVAHIAAVFSLIDENPHRITGPEVDSKLEVSLGRDRLQTRARVAKYETWRLAFFVFPRCESSKNASELEPDGAGPPL